MFNHQIEPGSAILSKHRTLSFLEVSRKVVRFTLVCTNGEGRTFTTEQV